MNNIFIANIATNYNTSRVMMSSWSVVVSEIKVFVCFASLGQADERRDITHHVNTLGAIVYKRETFLIHIQQRLR